MGVLITGPACCVRFAGLYREAYAVHRPGSLPELPDEVLNHDASLATYQTVFSLTLIRPPALICLWRNLLILRRDF